MSDTEAWVEQLSEIQEQLGDLYSRIESLRGELREAGRKTDATAFNEPLERLARYGRLFSDVLHTWTEPAE